MKLAAFIFAVLLPTSAFAEFWCEDKYYSVDKSIVAETGVESVTINGMTYWLEGCGTGFYCFFEETNGARLPTGIAFLDVGTSIPGKL